MKIIKELTRTNNSIIFITEDEYGKEYVSKILLGNISPLQELNFYQLLNNNNHILKLTSFEYDEDFYKYAGVEIKDALKQEPIVFHSEKALGDLSYLYLNNFKEVIPILDDLIYQLTVGYKYIIDNGILYNDFKAENILVYINDIYGEDNSNKYLLKYTDFGNCNFYNYQSVISDTLIASYTPPESVNKFYNIESSIFQIGLLFYELIYHKRLLSDDPAINLVILSNLPNTNYEKALEYFDMSKEEYQQNIDTLNGITLFKDIENKDLLDLLKRMLDFNNNTRITINEIIHHPYFNGKVFEDYTISLQNEKLDIKDKEIFHLFINNLDNYYQQGLLTEEQFFMAIDLFIRYLNNDNIEKEKINILIIIYIAMKYNSKFDQIPSIEDILGGNISKSMKDKFINSNRKILKDCYNFIIRRKMYFDDVKEKIDKDYINNFLSIMENLDFDNMSLTEIHKTFEIIYHKDVIEFDLEDKNLWIKSYFIQNENCILIYLDKNYAIIKEENIIKKILLEFETDIKLQLEHIKYYKLSNNKYLIYFEQNNYICSIEKATNKHYEYQNDLTEEENDVIKNYH